MLLNSDDVKYGGTGDFQKNTYPSESISWQGRDQSIDIEVPPLSVVILKWKKS